MPRPGRSWGAAAGCTPRSATPGPACTADRAAACRCVVRGGGRRVDPQRQVVGAPPDHLFTPVAENVAAQDRSGLRAVVRGSPFGVSSRVSVAVFQSHLPIQLLSSISRRRSASHQTAKFVDEGSWRSTVPRRPPGRPTTAPELVPRIAGVDVGREPRPTSTPGRKLQRIAPLPGRRSPCPGCSAPPCGPRSRGRRTPPARPGWIQIAHVHGVAVPQPRGKQPGAVVVDHHGPVDDLVPAVAVYVSHRQVVVPLPREGRRARPRPPGGHDSRVERPAQRQAAAPPVPRGEHGPPVVPAAHDEARPRAVQVRHGSQEAVYPVSDVVVVAVPANPAPAVERQPGRKVVGRASAAPVRPSKTVRYSGPVRILPRVAESLLIQSASGRR